VKKIAAVLALGFSVASASAFAQTFKGFVQDEMCAGKPAMKGNAECSKKCIKGGSPAVLVAEDGTIYKIANQSSVVPHAGENVTVEGKLNGDTITVDKVK
jgi:hypothetical protein